MGANGWGQIKIFFFPPPPPFKVPPIFFPLRQSLEKKNFVLFFWPLREKKKKQVKKFQKPVTPWKQRAFQKKENLFFKTKRRPQIIFPKKVSPPLLGPQPPGLKKGKSPWEKKKFEKG